MFFQHIYDRTLAQGSYLIGCQVKGIAMVIDPKRDISDYLTLAHNNKLRITHVAETHIHADYLSGAQELAAATGAQLYLSNEGGADWQYEFEHIGLKDGDQINLGNLTFDIIHTPGHTPESITLLLTDHPASDKPVMAFTGDFVFVGDVGRPDLLEKAAGIKGSKEEGAKQMFHSIQKFAQLPDHIQIWPAHGAGSACGKSLGSVPSSTIGYEKIRNWAFQLSDDESAFIKALLEDQPEPPTYFGMMKQLNKSQRSILTDIQKIPTLSNAEMSVAISNNTLIIDTRNKLTFAKNFIPNSLNIQWNNSFANWMGWMIDYNTPFIIIAEKGQEEKINTSLRSIGLDNVVGFFTNEISTLDIPLNHYESLSYAEFKEIVDNKSAIIVDIRNKSEFDQGHIKDAQHHFVGNLANELEQIPKNHPVVIHCQAGDRAAIGYSYLLQNGFNNIQNYFGGMAEWKSHQQATIKLK